MTTVKAKCGRWRKEPSETGLRRVCQGQRGYELREGDNLTISVSFASKRYGHNDMWYWVGIGRNTFSERLFFSTKEEAKSDADKAYKEWRKAH